ncbi:MAG TPA: FtsQ-type POTRA domain-containing protein [Candidatus Pelagibacter sp.]|jgi:cell division septal protein FtsQ|nr:FtsQ-type POTRA domain-containing protein [Candidatus Pelagibacter sp.]
MKKFYITFLLVLLFIFLTTYTPSELNKLPQKKNFFLKIKNIIIIDNQLISKNEINKKLSHIYGKNILFVKERDLKDPLNQVKFLNTIDVKKKYPDTILIKVNEAKPVAIIFKDSKKYLLDDVSNLHAFNQDLFQDTFPNVFGENADKNFIKFLNLLKNNGFPTKEVKEYYYFQIGRWDVKLLNNNLIKFPSKKIVPAIQRSVKLLNREDFKKYNLIDLRMNNEIVVE